ncbi:MULTISPECIES: DUF3568 family protein [unclassified Francisella]|uniref:DUF3568 family protein n=1 Tax=unclassified Francisella TaxID=2610885 RepID=UPI002E316602|nr:MULTISPECIES: DUF3568 family protein [unclassified Francisella]MED7819569.1 DUF3568 family protein [Francisella sp. 19S2-4]MED7830413.1 DUF3568 family protein [Francisella sp. 19S2-10]
MKKLLSIFLLAVCMSTLNSCLLVPYAVEQEAEYSENFDYSVEQVSHAVLDQFKNNKNITLTKNIITNERAVIEGKVDSKKYQGTFSINVYQITEHASTLEIKYDIFGDKVRSRELLLSVKKDLQKNYS